MNIVFDFHKKVDHLMERDLGESRFVYSYGGTFEHRMITMNISSIGTTKKGIGPTYAAKVIIFLLYQFILFDYRAIAMVFE